MKSIQHKQSVAVSRSQLGAINAIKRLRISKPQLMLLGIKGVTFRAVHWPTLEKVSGQRSLMGAIQNRLEHTINNLSNASEKITAAESRIRDVDMAKEMMSFQKNNIINQAATAMLAQANQQPQGVLQLLR